MRTRGIIALLLTGVSPPLESSQRRTMSSGWNPSGTLAGLESARELLTRSRSGRNEALRVASGALRLPAGARDSCSQPGEGRLSSNFRHLVECSAVRALVDDCAVRPPKLHDPPLRARAGAANRCVQEKLRQSSIDRRVGGRLALRRY